MQSIYTKPTDQKHKIKLESAIIYAEINSPLIIGSTNAAVMVQTSFVGQGAPLELTAKGEKSGTIGTAKGKIYGNHFTGTIPIQEKLVYGEDAWFEAKLPKHGLQIKSNTVPAIPAIKIKTMEWDREVAQRGDIVELKTVFENAPDELVVSFVIYEHDQDGNHDRIAQLKSIVKDGKAVCLWEYEYHDDVDDIPTDGELQEYGKKYTSPEYFFIIYVYGTQLNDSDDSGLLSFKDSIQITCDSDQNSNKEYSILLPDGNVKEGQLDDNGYKCEDNLPPGKVSIGFKGDNDYEMDLFE